MAVNEIVSKAVSFGVGGMNEEELAFLYDYCAGKDVLELGSEYGQSSYVIANVAKSLTCIDAWIQGCPFLEEAQSSVYKKEAPDMEGHFDRHMQGLKFRKIKGLTSEVTDHTPDRFFDVVLVDADHSYHGVKADIQNYRIKVKPGGVMIFHDYGGAWQGVQQAVDEQYKKLRIIHRCHYLVVCEVI